MNKPGRYLLRAFLFIAALLFLATVGAGPAAAQSLNPDPPAEPVKLVFIHHSCGENWLSDSDGGLGIALGNNNYFVSDTNYGWGPDSIGDATDYANWIDWFTGPNSQRYLAALYDESDIHSPYSRQLPDPGGENRIIMFKSCFPNSDLGGNPDDSPSDDEWFTVGHAKFVYNQLLTYFASRPDKLFVAITPPPLIDTTHAENAREFSRWLVEDWLNENNYTTNNVFVWDFHNVLTHPDNHHRVLNGSVEYTIHHGNGGLYYDSNGDDHPNAEGNRKSTAEFIPMLNAFYREWSVNAPEAPTGAEMSGSVPEEEQEPAQGETGQEFPNADAAVTGVIDDFESGSPQGTNGWEAYWDDATQSTLSCGIDSSIAHSGSASLRIDFHIEPDGWATCPIFFDQVQAFGNAAGVSFDYRSSSPGLLFNFDVYGGTLDNRETYHFTIESLPESIEGWIHYQLTWDQILRVEWEANPGSPMDPNQVVGLAFGFSTYPDTPNSGTIWIDNLSLAASEQYPQPEIQEAAPEPEVAAPQDQPQESEPEGSGETEPEPEAEPAPRERGLCRGSTALISSVVLAGIYLQSTKRLPRRKE
jgi:hypothetical protein